MSWFPITANRCGQTIPCSTSAQQCVAVDKRTAGQGHHAGEVPGQQHHIRSRAHSPAPPPHQHEELFRVLIKVDIADLNDAESFKLGPAVVINSNGLAHDIRPLRRLARVQRQAPPQPRRPPENSGGLPSSFSANRSSATSPVIVHDNGSRTPYPRRQGYIPTSTFWLEESISTVVTLQPALLPQPSRPTA